MERKDRYPVKLLAAAEPHKEGTSDLNFVSRKKILFSNSAPGAWSAPAHPISLESIVSEAVETPDVQGPRGEEGISGEEGQSNSKLQLKMLRTDMPT